MLLGSYLAIESFFDRNIMELVLRITVVLAILSALVLAVAYLRELFLAGLLALGLLLVIDNLGEAPPPTSADGRGPRRCGTSSGPTTIL